MITSEELCELRKYNNFGAMVTIGVSSIITTLSQIHVDKFGKLYVFQNERNGNQPIDFQPTNYFKYSYQIGFGNMHSYEILPIIF